MNLALLAGLWWWSWSVFPQLPAEIPGHIGPGGIRWDDTAFRSWFALPLVAAGLTLLHYGLTPVIRRTNRFNLPSSVPFSELHPEDQAEIRTLTVRFLQWMNVLLLSGFWLLQAGIRETALDPASGIGPATLLGIIYLLLAPTIATIAFLAFVTQAVRDAERRGPSNDARS